MGIVDVLDERSYYQLLGVESAANPSDIGESYYRIVKVVHPDRHARERDPRHKKALIRLYARLGEAHKVLTDPMLRRAYDEGLTQGHTRLRQQDAHKEQQIVDRRDPSSAQARQLLGRAEVLLAEQDYRGAHGQLKFALQLEPGSAVLKAAVERVDAARPGYRKFPLPANAKPAHLPAPQPAPAPAAAVAAPASDFARDHTRHPMSRPVRVKCGSWKQFEMFYTRDISRGGMFLKASKTLPVGTPLSIVLKLPDDREVIIPAHVVRAVESGQGKATGVGVAFDELDEDTRAELEQMLPRRGDRAPTDPGVAEEISGMLVDVQSPAEEQALTHLLTTLGQLRGASDFDVLGVRPDADASAVRRAFLELTKKYHPDVYGRFRSTPVRDAINETFYLVRRAYQRIKSGKSAPAPRPPVPQPVSQQPSRPLPVRSLSDDLFNSVAQEVPEAPPAVGLISAAREGHEALAERRYTDARQIFASSLDTNPRDRRLRAAYHLAAGLEARQAGNHDAATKHLETVLMFDKQCAEAVAALRSVRGGTT